MLVIYNPAFKTIFISNHHSDTIVSQLCPRICLVFVCRLFVFLVSHILLVKMLNSPIAWLLQTKNR